MICDGGQSKSSKVTFGVPAGYSSRPVIVFIVCKRIASEFADDALLYGWSCPGSVKETAYTTMVRQKLEYGCEALDPNFKKDISSLERVQRKAARFCSNNYHPTDSVSGMLSDLGWFSLETRRTIARLNLMYKIGHGTVDIDKNSYKGCIFLFLFSSYPKNVEQTTERHC